MIGVVVDRPVGEDGVGPLGLEDLAECLVVGRVDDRLAVELPRVQRARLQDFAGLLGLGDAAGAFRLARRPLALVQVEEDDLVPEVRVAGDGASAAVLGIAGMARR